jgi:Zn-dependent peptidase ImmA (M78 family)
MAQGEQINPGILVWARETAGLDIHDAAHKLAFTAGHNSSNQTKLLEMERGDRLPTRTQLCKIAKTYHRPLLTFYLSSPPKKSERGSDFRSTGADVNPKDNGLLNAILRDIQARQEMLTSALEDQDDLEPLTFVSSCSLSDDPQKVATLVRSALHLPATPEGRPSSPDELFKFLRAGIESMGVYVLFVGDLGSHHSALSEEVFRGFALADPRVPFVVINYQDARTARSFTLIHELVHIYLGESGISGTPEQHQGDGSAAKIEQFCNDSASYVLLLGSFELDRPATLRNADVIATQLYSESTARTWAVSEPLVAFRLRRLGWITPALHRQFSNAYTQRWRDYKASSKAKNQMKEGGPSYHTVKQYRLGDALMDAVRKALQDNRLRHTKAAKILGTKPASVEPTFRHFEKSVLPTEIEADALFARRKRAHQRSRTSLPTGAHTAVLGLDAIHR